MKTTPAPPPTAAELFEIMKVVGGHLGILQSFVLQVARAGQLNTQLLAVAGSNITADQRHALTDIMAKSETNCEHLEAVFHSFQEAFDEVVRTGTSAG